MSNKPVLAVCFGVVIALPIVGMLGLAKAGVDNAPVGIPNIPIITPLVITEYHEVEVTAPAVPGSYLVTPCEQEDSLNCYWDAATRGNGEGVSFVNLNGAYFYAE